ncbi:hypothetical protein B2J93_2259 [Marssonina coronariae]|uniref:Polysaccharide lyase n=1 Tax=Diplocarpon coronariae TaxID=2795749 RepID=A0A218YUM6_9HELO|nr:hypothetical protein B2J93_2259 [Marssonina coronariae]
MFFPNLAAASLLAASFTGATQIFSNKGTTSGWDATFIDAGTSGTVDQVSNVYYESPSALKMTQTYIPSGYDGRYHAEVHKYNVYKKGDVGFYGFMFRLSSEWQFDPPQSYNIAQFIADFTDLPCAETYMPSSMVWLYGDQLQSRVKNGNACPVSEQHTDAFPNLAAVTRGEWHKIVIQASWKSDATGYYKMWFDGASVLNRTGIKTTVTDARPFQFRVGLYANGWKDDDGMKGTQGFRQIWFDEIAAGTTFADADPGQW